MPAMVLVPAVARAPAVQFGDLFLDVSERQLELVDRSAELFRRGAILLGAASVRRRSFSFSCSSVCSCKPLRTDL